MPGYLTDVLGYLATHYAEAADGLVDKPPSRLSRGEGTERSFYILKIDLVNSTQLLHGRRRSTYLKVAHTFLSTLDRITSDYGADTQQTEYAGDSVLAYFPDAVSAENVLVAACYCRTAVREMARLDQTLTSINIQCRVALHYAPLVVSRVGPRGDSTLTAIGHPIHRVAKMEKDIPARGGRTTAEFFQQLGRENKKFLSPCYSESLAPPPLQAMATAAAPAASNPLRATRLAELLNPAIRAGLGSPVDIQNLTPQGQRPAEPQVIRTLVGYSINWASLYRDLALPLG